MNSKWIKDLHKTQNHKLLEENIGSILFVWAILFWGGSCLLKQWKQNQIKQIGLYQTKKLLHGEGNNQQNEKATY